MSIYADYLVTCFVCGCVAAWIAKSRGRNPSLWFFIGVALNVLVLVTIAYLENRRRETEPSNQGGGTNRPGAAP